MTTAVITGIGVVSAAGVGLASLREAMSSNRSAIRPLTVLKPDRYRHPLAGELRGAVGEGPPSSRCTGIALLAATEALDAARVERGKRNTIGVFFGTAGAEMKAIEEGCLTMWGGSAAEDAVLPTAAWITSRLADQLELGGPQFTFQNACSAGATAIAQAAAFIREEELDIAIAGGAEILCDALMAGFESLRALSGHGCFPFDVRRDGTVLGEGSAFLVLESEESARARDVVSIATMRGAGFSCDAYHRTRPHPDGAGAALAMRRALDDASIEEGEVGYISAHGTGTKLNDTAELRAVRSVFGDRASAIPISSLKSLTGHCIGASGAIEAVACCLALQEGLLPGTAGLHQQEEEFNNWRLLREPETESVIHALSNSFAFGGNNVSLLLSAPTSVRTADGRI